jgi:hypothetical protein
LQPALNRSKSEFESLETVGEVLGFVAPFNFDNGSSIVEVFENDIELIRNHYKTLFENLNTAEILQRAYVDTYDKLADFESRITAIEAGSP